MGYTIDELSPDIHCEDLLSKRVCSQHHIRLWEFFTSIAAAQKKYDYYLTHFLLILILLCRVELKLCMQRKDKREICVSTVVTPLPDQQLIMEVA